MVTRLLVGLLFAVGLSVVGPAPAAEAACDGPRSKKAATMTDDHFYSYVVVRGTRTARLRLTGNAIYVYCEQAVQGKPNKMKVKKMDWCWTFLSNEEHFWFDGTRFNAAIFWHDRQRLINPRPFMVRDDGTSQNCRTQKIRKADRRWMKAAHFPEWRAAATIVLNNVPDWGPADIESDRRREPEWWDINPRRDADLPGLGLGRLRTPAAA